MRESHTNKLLIICQTRCGFPQSLLQIHVLLFAQRVFPGWKSLQEPIQWRTPRCYRVTSITERTRTQDRSRSLFDRICGGISFQLSMTFKRHVTILVIYCCIYTHFIFILYSLYMYLIIPSVTFAIYGVSCAGGIGGGGSYEYKQLTYISRDGFRISFLLTQTVFRLKVYFFRDKLFALISESTLYP